MSDADNTVTYRAATDLSGSVGRFAAKSTTDLVILATAAHVALLGVIVGTSPDGLRVTVAVSGKANVIAGAELTPGTHLDLTSDGDGEAVGAGAEERVGALNLSTVVQAAGSLVPVLIINSRRPA